MKKLLLLALSIVLISCDQDKEAEQPLKGEITELENQLKIADSINIKLHERIKNLEYNNHNYEISIYQLNEQYSSQIRLENIIKTEQEIRSNAKIYYHFLDKKRILSSVFSLLNLKNHNIHRTLINNQGLFYRYASHFYHEHNKEVKNPQEIAYFFKIFDRSDDNITSFFLEDSDFLQTMYSLFSNNRIYKDSGIQAMISSMLYTYQEYENMTIAKRDSIFSSFHNKFTNIPINDYASEQIKWLLSDENFSTYEIKESDLNSRMFYVYSFWARRHNEGNSEIVYELLKEINENLSQEEIQEHGNIEEEEKSI